ncbi:MAG: HEAT repeat domain-containing protein [Rubripirellula sp.]
MSNEQSTQITKWISQLASSPDEQIDVLRQLARQEDVCGITVPVVALAGSSDDEVRMWASEALESVVQPQTSEIPALIAQVEDPDDGEVCYWAATMLGRLGAESASAVDALGRCLADSMYLPARERAVWALAQIGSDAVSATDALASAVANGPARLSRLASDALKAINGGDPSQEAAA